MIHDIVLILEHVFFCRGRSPGELVVHVLHTSPETTYNTSLHNSRRYQFAASRHQTRNVISGQTITLLHRQILMEMVIVVFYSIRPFCCLRMISSMPFIVEPFILCCFGCAYLYCGRSLFLRVMKNLQIYKSKNSTEQIHNLLFIFFGALFKECF